MSVYPDGAAEPLLLVRTNERTGKLELGERAAAALRAIRTPIGVIAVCGRARTGKSYLLNQLLGRSTGFKLAHSHRPCTKGLWIWSKPFKRVGPDGVEYHLVLLDSEGVDAYDQTAQDGVQLLALAVLLSSLFVFNQMGAIDEAALDRLALVTQITRHIRVRAGDAAEDARELGEFTPSFLWLLRDFYFNLSNGDDAVESDGTSGADGGRRRRVGPGEYLEAALAPASGRGRGVDAKNAIRASIKALFPDRDCFTLVRPAADEEALVRLDSLPQEQLRPQFQEGINRLTALLLSRASPKRVGSQVVSGPMLAGLAGAYVEAINQGAVPTIATAWQGVAEAECRRAAAAAEAAYKAAFEEAEPVPEPAALQAQHEHALAAARAAFKAIAVGDASLRGGFKRQALAGCEARFELVRDRVLAKAEAATEALLAAAAQQLSTSARLRTTWPEIQVDFDTVVADYSTRAAGATKWPRLAAFLQQQYAHCVSEFVARAEERAAAALRDAEGRAREAALRLRAAEGRAAKAEVKVSDLSSAESMLRDQLQRERHKGLGCLSCVRPSTF